jgi:hypothetical protein
MTTLTNGSYINKFDEKLKIYNGVFFKTINGYGGLLSEATKITVPALLPMPPDAETNAYTYNTEQFAIFIRNIVNFNIKNYDTLDNTKFNMDYVNVTGTANSPVYSFNNNIKNNIIETLKVINIFVDILEAYKFCIDNEGSTVASIPVSGYTLGVKFDRIELVSDTSRFYDAAGNMLPDNVQHKNVGFIRKITEVLNGSTKTVLYLSIQSFYTGMNDNKYNYNKFFIKTKISSSGNIDNDITNSNKIFTTAAKDDAIADSVLANTRYAHHVYSGAKEDDPPSTTNLTLDQRNRSLIQFLLKTLFNLDPNHRKENVSALYYYYKFVQLYSTLIINVSNVMYANINRIAYVPYCIDTRNMSTEKNMRSVSGIEVITEGRGYTTIPSITIAAQSGVTGSTGATATIIGSSGNIIPTTATVNITNGGSKYNANPTTITSSFTPVAVGGVQPITAVFKATIAPIVMEDNVTNHENNIFRLERVLNEVSNSLSELMSELSKSDTTYDVITTADNAEPAVVYKDGDNKVFIKITNGQVYNKLNDLNNKNDLVRDYIIYDLVSKNYYTILKVEDEKSNDIRIKINAVFTVADYKTYFDNSAGNESKSAELADIKIFKDSSIATITGALTDTSPTKIAASFNFLAIMKKDINSYKNEYINNREEVEILDEKIKFNSTKVENNKNLYDTQYNKNVFLNRQIISYNTIIGGIILMLVLINLLNIEKQVVKTISLASLGVVLLLFVIYFVSNITYIESFVVPANNILRKVSTDHKIANPTFTDTQLNSDKVRTLKDEIDKLNNKFISYFEKLIITLPATDNTDFYSEIKEVITSDKHRKIYTNNMLEINRTQATNDMDTIKYEIEQSKLYIFVLLVAAIIFITLYNVYINYVSNDKYISLMLFICSIVLIIIVSYYIIKSNRRVRTVYKSIYWGPESSPNF